MHNVPLIPWPSMFMGVALLAAARSKDSRKRNGACIASADNKILGVGYNGLPRGCDDDDESYWADEDDNPLRSRHSYIVHAEVNAILNCVVLPLTDSTIYTTQFPCPRCVQSIIQVGIRRVVYLAQKSHQAAQNAAAQKMLDDAGVQVLPLQEVEAAAATWCTELDGFISATGPSAHRSG
jgi:dCMP deaminase